MITAVLTVGSLSSLIFAVIIFRTTSDMLFDILGPESLVFTIWTHPSQLYEAFYLLRSVTPRVGGCAIRALGDLLQRVSSTQTFIFSGAQGQQWWWWW